MAYLNKVIGAVGAATAPLNVKPLKVVAGLEPDQVFLSFRAPPSVQPLLLLLAIHWSEQHCLESPLSDVPSVPSHGAALSAAKVSARTIPAPCVPVSVCAGELAAHAQTDACLAV